MSRIGEAFRSLNGEGALVAYVMAGDPDIGTTERVVSALVRGGADVIELGIPFSDPIADGRSIQEASVRALASGTKPAHVLGLVSRLKARHSVPIAVMTYYNIIYSPGLASFLDAASKASVDGLIVPDLPLDETGTYSRLARSRGLDTIMLAAPTTIPARMESLVEHSSGFLYLVSLLGVTGARAAVTDESVGLVRSAKRLTSGRIPLAVGFGISRPEHVASMVSAGADGVIVGSGFVDRIASVRPRDEMLEEVEGYARSLKSATRAKRGIEEEAIR